MGEQTKTQKTTKKTTSRKNKPNPKGNKVQYRTHDGQPLTIKEAKFIDSYVECGNQMQAIREAGYLTKCPSQYAQDLLDKPRIANEIKYRLEKLESQKIASAAEILQYLTSVMRGEITDQFGLDAPLSERTKAAQELAKRKIDIPNRLEGKEQPEVKITLNWKRE